MRNTQVNNGLLLKPVTSRALTASGLATVLAFWGGAAWAQTASSGTAATAVETVVVTGSLISNPNYTSASPISSVSITDLKQSGSITLESSLTQLPEFQTGGNEGNGIQGTGGRATLNLRGLGANRNLVLLDGRRLPISDSNGEADINLVPQSIISGVDVVTGGASAIYGSDAISGAVNFKTISNFEGLRADVQYGDSWRADRATVDVSIAGGTEFDHGRGHALLSASFSHRDGLPGRARGFFANKIPSSFLGTGAFVPDAGNLPSQAVVNVVFAKYGVANNKVKNTQKLGFNNDSTLFQQDGAANFKTPTGSFGGLYAILGGNVRMPVGLQTVVLNGLDRKSIFGKFDYRLSSHVTAYGQYLYVDSETDTASGGSLTQFAVPTIPVTNPFIPADLATVLASRSRPTAPFTFNGRYVGVPYKSFDEHFFTSEFLGGLRGDLPFLPFSDWTYDLYVSYSTTDHQQAINNAVLFSRVQTLFNAPDGGASICAGGFNPFGQDNAANLSQACQNFISTTANSHERNTEINLTAKVQGSLIHLPAGDVQLALEGDYRRDTYKFDPDSQLAAQNLEAIIASSPAHGAISVHEGAAQIDVPVLRDLPLVRKLNIGGAYRFSSYTTSGDVQSWEGEVKWSPIDSLLVRAGVQRAIRAPNIAELFAAPTGGQIAFGSPPTGGEPCDSRLSRSAQLQALCVATGIPSALIATYIFPTTATASLTTGNPDLRPEKGFTYNAGFVYTSDFSSPWLSDLSLSVDYWNIRITRVISPIPGNVALSKCYNQDGSNPTFSPNNFFCSLITREPTDGTIQQIRTPFLNLGSLRTDGVDIGLRWSIGLADIGIPFVKSGDRISVNTGVSYTHDFLVQTLQGGPTQSFGGTNTIVNQGGPVVVGGPHPTWKALTTFGYDYGNGTVAMRWRYLDAMADVTKTTNPKNRGPGVGAYNVFDLVGTYDFHLPWHDSDWRLRAGITNLFNRGLPFVASSQNGTDVSTFDAVGRAFYVGFQTDL